MLAASGAAAVRASSRPVLALLLLVLILLGADAAGLAPGGTARAETGHGPAAFTLEEDGLGEHGPAGHEAPHLPGEELGLVWVVPFVGILLSIAFWPLVAPGFWHRNFGKISGAWALAFLIPFALQHGVGLAVYELLHTALSEFIPFIILLTALFTVAGGIRVKGTLVGTPAVNTGMLAIGTFLASWMGTTGAAMLLIRPLLRSNQQRRFKVHTVVFFIFLVANIGGSLTPLGDPPLFLGFLKGVDFFWPTRNMLLPMLTVALPLLAVYFLLDTYLLRREGGIEAPPEDQHERLGLEGAFNFVLLAAVIGAVLMSGLWEAGITFRIYHVEMPLQNVVRDLLLVGIAVLSWQMTSRESRRRNGFTWFPMVEVAKLFAGIFITIIPAIAILRAGTEGAGAPLVALVNQDGQPVQAAYFWITGMLSSFLDNAPTYLVFFNTAGGDAVQLMAAGEETLLAISCGAVFMGANTYIGNAPNFMVRAIAEERDIRMPSFFGYMGWSLLFLMPLFLLITFVFFHPLG